MTCLVMIRGALFIQAAVLSIAVGNPIACLSQAVPPSPGEIYKKAAPGVVLIEAYGLNGKVFKTGSGFLVGADGRLLTNYHVIAHSKQATVRLANGDAYDTVQVLSVDRRKDIALLKIQAVELPHLPLGRSSGVEVGQSIYLISTPLGFLQNTLSQGIVSGIREFDGYRAFQVTAPLSRGSSGGPVFNAAGEVIGIAVFLFEGGQNLNFAIPIDYARGMLSANTPTSLESVYEPEPTPEKVPPDVNVPTKPEASDTPRVKAAAIPEEMKKHSGIYLEKHLRVWTPEQAEPVLGAPLRRRPALNPSGSEIGDILAYRDPTGLFRELELNFDRQTKTLQTFYVYPWNMTWEQCKRLWGDDVIMKKNPDGTRHYTYKNRRVNVYCSKDGKVISYGVY